MTEKEIKKLIDGYIFGLNKKERAHCIILLDALSEEEVNEFIESMEYHRLTDEMKKRLEKCSTKEMRSSYIDYFDRFVSFQKEDWLAYLRGELTYMPKAYKCNEYQ